MFFSSRVPIVDDTSHYFFSNPHGFFPTIFPYVFRHVPMSLFTERGKFPPPMTFPWSTGASSFVHPNIPEAVYIYTWVYTYISPYGDGWFISWKILLKLMIWEYPNFRKPPYIYYVYETYPVYSNRQIDRQVICHYFRIGFTTFGI